MIENKNALPSMSTFFYICEYLDITPKDFFDEENPHPKPINDFVDILKQLKEDDFSALMNMAHQLNKKR